MTCTCHLGPSPCCDDARRREYSRSGPSDAPPHIVGAVSRNPTNPRHVESVFAPVKEAIEELKRHSGVGGPAVRPVPTPLSLTPGGGAGTQPEGEE